MRIEDLMVGDWVLLDNNAWIDDEYDRRCGVPDYQPHKIESGEDLEESVNADGGALPIPLTPEILEKNGFVKFPHKDEDNFRFNYSEYNDSKGEFDLHIENGIRKGSTCGEIYEYVFTAIRYVHELQHALKVCKIEKEIVL